MNQFSIQISRAVCIGTNFFVLAFCLFVVCLCVYKKVHIDNALYYNFFFQVHI